MSTNTIGNVQYADLELLLQRNIRLGPGSLIVLLGGFVGTLFGTWDIEGDSQYTDSIFDIYYTSESIKVAYPCAPSVQLGLSFRFGYQIDLEDTIRFRIAINFMTPIRDPVSHVSIEFDPTLELGIAYILKSSKGQR